MLNFRNTFSTFAKQRKASLEYAQVQGFVYNISIRDLISMKFDLSLL